MATAPMRRNTGAWAPRAVAPLIGTTGANPTATPPASQSAAGVGGLLPPPDAAPSAATCVSTSGDCGAARVTCGNRSGSAMPGSAGVVRSTSNRQRRRGAGHAPRKPPATNAAPGAQHGLAGRRTISSPSPTAGASAAWTITASSAARVTSPWRHSGAASRSSCAPPSREPENPRTREPW